MALLQRFFILTAVRVEPWIRNAQSPPPFFAAAVNYQDDSGSSFALCSPSDTAETRIAFLRVLSFKCSRMHESMYQIETTAESHATETVEWLSLNRFAIILALLAVAMFPGVLLFGQTLLIRDFGL